MLTADLQADLANSGIVRLHEAFDPAQATRMRAVVWRELGRAGVREAEPATWPSGRQGGKAWKRGALDHRAFQAFWTPAVVSALDALLGAKAWTRPTKPNGILLTFPEPGETVRQLDPLHSDFAMDIPAEPLFAVNLFSFIASVRSRSGGTLVIRNSHRVVQRYLDTLPPRFPRTKAATQFAVDNSWLVSMARRAPIGATHDCSGIEVQLEELTGEPGDVVMTHPWTLHAGATSAGTTPRIMLRHHVYRIDQTKPATDP